MAGSRGFIAVMVDLGNQNFFNLAVYSTLRNGFAVKSEARDCWNGSATGGDRIDNLIRKKLPLGITQTLAQAVWSGDKAASQEMQAILKKAKEPDGHNDVDGIYLINAKDGKITLMALGSRGPLGKRNPTPKITIAWNETDPAAGAADFDLALCRASKPLGYHFNP